MTTSISVIGNEIKKVIYSIFILSMLFLFHKMIKHRYKNYGLLMVLILAVPLFINAIFRLLTLFRMTNSIYVFQTYRILSKFASYWTLCLAIYHYSVLKSFKTKFWQFSITGYTLFASLLCLTISILTSLPFIESWDGDFFILDVSACLILWLIFYGAYKYRNAIGIGPYSLQGSTKRLMKFACIQGCFSGIYVLLDFLKWEYNCSSPVLSHSQIFTCEVFNAMSSLVNQAWIWYAVIFNWKMVSMSERNESIVDMTLSISLQNAA